MTILIILTKLFISSGILFGYYRLFLRNRRFHRYNRFYLLGSVAVSMLLPFLKIEVLLSPTAPANHLLLNTLNSITVNEGEVETVAPVVSSNWMDWFTSTHIMWTVYIIGAFVFLSLLIRSIIYIRKIQHHYQAEKIDDLKFYNTGEPGTPFSYFRNIFWNNKIDFNSAEGQQIFRHELFHVRQQHSADLLFMEIALLLAWFNPFFYLIKKELKAIHEFLADEYAVSNSDEYAYAELLVLFALNEKQNKLVHPFFHNTIKRRIAMITNLKNKKVGYLGRIMALPLSILLFSFIVLKAEKTNNITEMSTPNNTVTSASPLTIILDAGHGGNAGGAISSDKNIYEKEITLSIVKRIEALASSYNVKTILTRKEDETIKNIDRMLLIEANTHDLVLSIHVNAKISVRGNTVIPSEKSGFEVYISRNSNEKTKAAALAASTLIQSLKGIYKTDETIKKREFEGIYILDNGPSPAVMVECGYITNSKDLAFITDPVHQEEIAKKILEGLVAYSNANTNSAYTAPEQNTKGITSDTVPRKVLESAVLTIKRPEKKSPSQKEWDSWKDEKIYGVWLDGKRIKNEVLGNHAPNEYSWYMVSKLATTAINYGKHYYQVDLYSHDYFKMQFPEKTKTINVQKMSYVSDTVKLSPEAFSEKMANKNGLKPKAKLAIKDGFCYLKIENDPNVYSVSVEEITSYEKKKNDGKESSNEDSDVTFYKTEIESHFIGGINGWGAFLSENLHYPKEAIDKNIQGTVMVQFIIDKEGNVSDVKAVSGDPILAVEAVRVIKISSGKWSPALQNNRKVKAYKKQPVVFKLEA